MTTLLDSEAHTWHDTMVYTTRLSSLTVEQWVAEAAHLAGRG